MRQSGVGKQRDGHDDERMGGPRSRRTAATAGALGAGSAAVAVWLVHSYGWADASAVVSVAALPTVLVGVYLALETRFGPVGAPGARRTWPVWRTCWRSRYAGSGRPRRGCAA
jgi:hypothetical protein